MTNTIKRPATPPVESTPRAPSRGSRIWRPVFAAVAFVLVGAAIVFAATSVGDSTEVGLTKGQAADAARWTARVEAGVSDASSLTMGQIADAARLNAQAATKAPVVEPAGSLYTAQERALIEAVQRGEVPEQALDTETLRMKDLVNRGLIPRQALEPAVELGLIPAMAPDDPQFEPAPSTYPVGGWDDSLEAVNDGEVSSTVVDNEIMRLLAGH